MAFSRIQRNVIPVIVKQIAAINRRKPDYKMCIRDRFILDIFQTDGRFNKQIMEVLMQTKLFRRDFTLVVIGQIISLLDVYKRQSCARAVSIPANRVSGR